MDSHHGFLLHSICCAIPRILSHQREADSWESSTVASTSPLHDQGATGRLLNLWQKRPKFLAKNDGDDKDTTLILN